jgi:hypothetical protein
VPNGVRFIRDLRYENTQKASAKRLGPCEQDHEILKRINGYVRPDEPSIVRFVPDCTCQKQQKHQRKAMVCMSKTTKYSKGYLRADVPNGVRFIRDLRYENTQKASAKRLGSRERDHENT